MKHISELEFEQTVVTNKSEPKRNENSDLKCTGSNENNNNPKSYISKIQTAIAFLTIEPFLLFYILPNSISSIAVQRLNLEKACRVDLGHTKEKCDESDGNINVTIAVQSIVADMTTWQVPLTCAIPAIVILFVGAWSDRTGIRKVLMIIPMFGELVSAFGLLLATHYFEEWPLFVTALIESLPTAFSGGFSIALMGALSYLADVTTLESRTFRTGIAVIIVTLGAPVATSISGVLLEAIGYYGIFGLTTSLYLCGVMYTYFRIHDVNPIKNEEIWYRKLINFFHPSNAWDTLCIIFQRGPNRNKIILVIAAHIVLLGPLVGTATMEYQYLLLKYNMDDVEISLYFSYAIIVGICGTMIAMSLFCKYMKMHDAILGIIAATGKVVSSIVYALAPNKPWYYSGPVFDIFGDSGFVAIRSLGTKVVEPEEVAKMCSILGLVDAIIPIIYTPMYTQMYKATIATLPGAFYLLGGTMTVPAIFVFMTLYIVCKKGERDKAKNSEDKEKYVHENDVTKF